MAARKNTMRWIAALLLAAFAMVAMGQSSCSTETDEGEASKSEAPAKQEAPAPDPPEVTAAMVVDGFSTQDINDFCEAVEVAGYDQGLSYFKAGFKQASLGDLSAEEVFDETLTRC